MISSDWRSLCIVMDMYPHDRYKRRELAENVLSWFPAILPTLTSEQRDILTLWFRSQGLAVGGASGVSGVSSSDGWLEVFRLFRLHLAKLRSEGNQFDLLGAFRVIVWSLLRLS